jgi:hypothetical protein
MNKIKNKTITVAYAALTVADKVLLGLWDMFDDISYSQIHPRLVLAVGARRAREIVSAKERFRQERKKKKALWQLKRNKWIKLQKEGERVEYEITKNGRLAALEIIMRCTNSCLPAGEACLVIFDFPEAAKESRQTFRRFLRRIGFEFIQLSVWSSKKNIFFEIREAVGILKLGRWVKIYRGYED